MPTSPTHPSPASRVNRTNRRFCTCARGRYEAHCAERGVFPVCPPESCGTCHYGIVYERAAVFPASVAVAVESARQEGARSARPLAPDGSPIIFGLLVGAEFDGSGPGRIDLTLRVPGNAPNGALEVGFHVNRALPRAVAVERMHAGLSHYRRVLSGSAEADFLLALHGTACVVTCWRGGPEDMPDPHTDPARVRAHYSPWWTHEGTLGELLYPATTEAS